MSHDADRLALRTRHLKTHHQRLRARAAHSRQRALLRVPGAGVREQPPTCVDDRSAEPSALRSLYFSTVPTRFCSCRPFLHLGAWYTVTGATTRTREPSACAAPALCAAAVTTQPRAARRGAASRSGAANVACIAAPERRLRACCWRASVS